MNIVGAYSDYDYGIFDPEGSDSFKWQAGIDYKNLKADFTYFLNEKHRLEFGGGVVWYTLYPGKLTSDEGSSINPDELEPENSRESAVYISDEYSISKRITLYAGLRYSYYSIYGPKTINLYREGLPKNEDNVIGEKTFEEGETIRTFDGWEPRLSLRFGINNKSSVKLSFNRMYQYIHLISNTISISPIDIWKSSDYYLGPQYSDQYSIGYFRNFMSNTIETSLEFYYKNIYDLVDFKDGAELFLNPNLENALLQGEGRAYGVEMMINKTLGRLTGWVSYAYSRTERKIEGQFDEETINNGFYYPANYDKPHDIKISGSYKITRRFSFSANFIYSTGRPTTYPSGKYTIDRFTATLYSDRNQERIPDYHRLDISISLLGNHKKNKRWKGSWTFSVYNVYGRKNAYSVFFKTERGVHPRAYKLSILGSAFPAITYNFSFK
jgi:outer membrane receptor for ferrienterochelin and colicin